MRSGLIGVFLLLVSFLSRSSAAQSPPPPPPPQPAAPSYKEAVEVVGVTPIHGLGVPKMLVPANVQILTAGDIGPAAAMSFGALVSSRLASVHLNEAQANPFQPDLQFRGFVASPLLGLPQGLAVYQDGVRANEPFGDTVNWDLLPTNAIASVNLMPGSSPLFGLNALGGAVSIQTKTGFTHPGHAVHVFGGSFGRRWIDVESGGHSERLSYFVAGHLLGEDGWRDFSPSRLRQAFGSVEWRGRSTTVGASTTAGANRLIGNGVAPVQLLDLDRAAVFTHPDETKTRVAQVSLRASHVVGRQATLDGVLFYRPGTIGTFNGDDTTYGECGSATFRSLLCRDDGTGAPVRDQAGQFVPVDDRDPFSGTNNVSSTRTRGWGGSFQASVARPLASRANQFIAGMSLDRAGSRYEADTEIARLTDSRGTAGTGILDVDASVRLRATSTHAGFYVADFFTVVPRLTISGSARYTRSLIELRDGPGDDLNGDHQFGRFNPSAGATYQLTPNVTAYGSYSSASRVPTPSELGCADPEDPCRLPNAFVADPPLEQVVAHTWEAGLRGRRPGLRWSGSAFRTINRDDIIFISSGALTSEGHFANVGDTGRAGVEVNLAGAATARVQWNASYTYLRARFWSPLILPSPNHPEAIDGEIAVRAGSSLPGIPRHNLKLNLLVTGRRTSVGTDLSYMSSQFMRGDEANLLSPIAGRAVVNATASYLIGKRLRLSGHVTNLFGTPYSTFGQLGQADDVLGDGFEDPRFVSPAAPRAAWIGVEIVFR